MTTYTYKQLYNALPCNDGLSWLKGCEARGLSLAQAWDECSRADWMFWALGKLNIQLNVEQDLLLQVEFLQTPLSDGRVVEDLLTDKCSRAFVALKRRRLAGEVVEDTAWAAAVEDAARSAARAAAWGVAQSAAWGVAWSAAAAAAGDAAWAAAWSAARAAVGAATRAAAWDAAGVAAWAAAWDAAGVAAWAAAWAWQANKLREIIGNPFAEE